MPGFSCDQCTKTFTEKVNLDRHKRTKHPDNSPPQFQCDQCSAKFNRKDNLKRHQEGHGNTARCHTSTCRAHPDQTFAEYGSHEQHPVTGRIPLDSPFVSEALSGGHPGASTSTSGASDSAATVQQREPYKCPDCNYTCQNWCVYVRHRGRCHQLGYGAEDHHILPVLNEEGVMDQSLQDLYRRHAHEIYIEHYQGAVHAEYNFPTTNGTITYQDIRNHLEEILRSEQQAFKVNMAFGIVLRDIITAEYTFFHPLESDGVLERPILITNQRDIDTFMDLIKNLNILEHLSKKRPNTRKVFHSVTNIMFYVNRTNFVLGAAEDLPDYIKSKTSIITLVRDCNGKDLYQDNKCLFRCLALKFGATQRNLENKSNALLQQWCVHKNLISEQFNGVHLKDIPQVEDLFRININIHTLLDADTAISVYLSSCQYPSTLYCHLWRHHLSYITNFNTFAKRFHCHLCDKLFSTPRNARRHEKTCDQGTKFIYPGGYHRVTSTVFEDLESHGINVPKQDRLYPFFCCYDFEAVLVKNKYQKGEVTTVLQSHSPISVAIASNVIHPDCKHTGKEPACHLCLPLREPVCFVEPDVSLLLDQLFAKAGQIQEAAEACTRKKLHPVFAKLEQKISVLEAQKAMFKDSVKEEEADGHNVDIAAESNEPDEPMDPRMEKLIKKRGTFNRFMENLVQENTWGLSAEEDESSDNEEFTEEDNEEQEDGADDYSDFQQKEVIKQLEIFKGLKNRLEEYARVLPLLGFNNAR